MAYHRFPDGEEGSISLYMWDGRCFVSEACVPHWHEVTAMASREEDVLLCGYPKSGLHWLWDIVTMLKTGTAQITDGRMETQGFLMMSSLSLLDALPSPRILTTHRRFHDVPSNFILKRRKMVCVLREPKDICVSYYHMLRSLKSTDYDGTFQGFVPLFLSGRVPMDSWTTWVLSYEKGLKEHPELSPHVIHYEKLKANPEEEIRRLAQYLGCPENLAEAVAQQTQFSVMKANKTAEVNPLAKYYKNKTETIYRKGETEEWRQYFTAEQAADFDAKLQENLGRASIMPKL